MSLFKVSTFAIFLLFSTIDLGLGLSLEEDEEPVYDDGLIVTRETLKRSEPCFGPSTDPLEFEDKVAEMFSASPMQKCYTQPDYDVLFKASGRSFGQRFDSLKFDYCLTWNGTKSCIFKHLRANCNEGEVKRVQDSLTFTSILNFPALMCEKGQGDRLRQLFLTSVNTGLWDCMKDNVAFMRRINACTNVEAYLKGGALPAPKAYLKKYSSCIQRGIKLCSNDGDSTQNSKMVTTLRAIEDAFGDAYDLIWREFKNSKA